jgi:hypothetical protein
VSATRIALPALLLLACNGGTTTSSTDDTGPTDTDTGTTATVPDVCADLGLTALDFDATAPTANRRWEPAGDFSVPLRDGTTWTLSEQWTGCDSYVFLPHWWYTSAFDDTTWWTSGVHELLEHSPPNVHYFFVVYSNDADQVEEYAALAETEIEFGLGDIDSELADWFRDRVHVINAPLSDIDGLVGDMSSSDVATLGWAVDRHQQVRSTGYPPDVEAYDADLNNAGEWPWEMELYSAANEAHYYNYEATRQEALDAVDATIVPIFGGDVQEQYVDGPVILPDAPAMAGFDTLEIDVLMECPDKDTYELNNCGAWDYLAYLWLWDEDTETWLEMGRFITTYHRESRWVVDASHALAWLLDGGERTVRYEWAPSWNVQPTGITVNLRLSNQDKGTTPVEIHPLFTGGSYSDTFHDDRPPVDVVIPADATKVEVVSIATGHGAETYSCAEFCDQTHTFSIGADSWADVQDNAGTETGCRDDVPNGTVPNQAGTWWFGRAGWCPGRRVDPFVADVTASVIPGETATVSYQAEVSGSAPTSSRGNLEMRSWLVVSK